ncbi:MAG: hypothetical protein ACP5I1_08270, partial [Candidatus Hinthialibacter sp.]
MNVRMTFSVLGLAVFLVVPPAAPSSHEPAPGSATAALSLSVYDSIMMALKNNRSLAVQQYD